MKFLKILKNLDKATIVENKRLSMIYSKLIKESDDEELAKEADEELEEKCIDEADDEADDKSDGKKVAEGETSEENVDEGEDERTHLHPRTRAQGGLL